MIYTLPKPFLGYDAGAELRDVTLREARSWECNRCGDCCAGDRENVRKDEASGMPLLVWGSRYPEDFYRERYGEPLIIPLVPGEDGAVPGGAFATNDHDGKPYTAFRCSFLEETPGAECETSCRLMRENPEPDPKQLAEIRPRSCGEFPVFGLDIDAAIIDGHSFVPPTGALPRCTWHGIRIVGPWRETGYWRDRWERQQAGDDVDPSARVEDFTPELLVLADRR